MSVRCRQAAFAVALVAAVSLCVPALATEDDMDRLPPVVDPYRCLICHQQEDPGAGDASLNVFGEAFLDNLRLWNADLASRDSDGDGCVNGVELGDVDGDGENDQGVDVLQNNPGVVDCGATVDQRTWGDLKALFDHN